jgi:hypothetical protein
MTFLYAIAEEHSEAIVRVASEAFEKAFKIDRQQAVDVANAMIGALVSGIARACVGKAAEAIGSAELTPLLEKLTESLADEDSKLILLVAKVVGEREYPKEEVEDFVKDLRASNILPISVLAFTVARRFYLDPPERGIRDSACRLLSIDVKRLPEPSKGKR